jgi:hypothetical protein
VAAVEAGWFHHSDASEEIPAFRRGRNRAPAEQGREL